MRVITAEFKAALVEIDHKTNRAAMWAMRENARKVKDEFQKIAPVYRGSRTHARVPTGSRAQRAAGRTKKIPIVPGLYRDSISASRNIRESGTSMSLKIGPRGGHVMLYAGKLERKYAPMRRAFEAAKPTFGVTYELAIKKALALYG